MRIGLEKGGRGGGGRKGLTMILALRLHLHQLKQTNKQTNKQTTSSYLLFSYPPYPNSLFISTPLLLYSSSDKNRLTPASTHRPWSAPVDGTRSSARNSSLLGLRYTGTETEPLDE